MSHYLLELDDDLKVALKSSIKLLNDKKWHDIYELHEKYRLSPSLIVDSIKFLSSHELIKVEGSQLAFVDTIDNDKVSLLNYLMKNDIPLVLKKNNFNL